MFGAAEVPIAAPDASRHVQRFLKRAGIPKQRSAGTGNLLEETVLVVLPRLRFFQRNPEYTAHDYDGNQIGAAVHVEEFRGGRLGGRKSVRFQVTDMSGSRLLSMTYPTTLLKKLNVSVLDARGIQIGEIVQSTYGLLKELQFDLESAGGNLGTVRRTVSSAWNLSVQDRSGKLIARVESRARSKQSSRKNPYSLQVGLDVVEPLRSLVIGSAIIIDAAFNQPPVPSGG